MKQGIQDRSFDFAVRIVNLSNHLPDTKAGRVLGNQVLRSGTSIGANVEEAEAAYSRETFCYKMNIALSEARETHYWLRVLKHSKVIKPERLNAIIDETEELKKILGAIVSTTRGKSRRGE